MQNTLLSFIPLSAASPQPKSADIWLLDFSALSETQIANSSHLVSADELARAQTIKRKPHHFLAARVLLRKVLAFYTGLPSDSLEFARREQGKPFLINAPHPIYFNLSHSGNFAALAVTTTGEVGIDIETIRARNYLAIAERYFHTDELKQLLEKKEAEQEQLFFKLWTLKEAFFKATGGGISSGLNKAVFDIKNKVITARLAAELGEHETAWQFQQECITPSTLAALALHTTEPIQPQWFDGNALLTN